MSAAKVANDPLRTSSHPRRQDNEAERVNPVNPDAGTAPQDTSDTQPKERGRLPGTSALHMRRRAKDAPVVVTMPSPQTDSPSKVAMDLPSDAEGSQPKSEDAKGEEKKPAHKLSSVERWGHAALSYARSHVAWIPPVVCSWAKMKPLIRSSITGWICLLMLVIAPIERRLGNASFLILIGAFIAPSELPFFACLEREFFTLLLLLCSWAWSCLGIFIAYHVRQTRLPVARADINAIFAGTYIEARPSVVLGVFLAFGAGAALYLKARFGPSPFLFGSILSCILLDISLTDAALFPYPYYTIANAITVPLALKAAINIVVSAIFFPKTVNSQYVERLIAVLTPLRDAQRDQVALLERTPLDSEFDFKLVHRLVTQAEAGIAPLHMSARLLLREVSFGVANGQDLKTLESLATDLVPSADGHAYYYTIIANDLKQIHFPRTPAASRFASPATTPAGTPHTSRPPSPTRRSHSRDKTATGGTAPLAESSATSHAGSDHFAHSIERGLHRLNNATSRRPSTVSTHGRHKAHHSHAHHPWSHLLHFPRPPSPHEPVAVGVWESLRYEGVEVYLHNKYSNQHTELFAHLLGETSKDILEADAVAIDHVLLWLRKLNSERTRRFRDRFLRTRVSLVEEAKERAGKTKEVIGQLQAALEQFDKVQRLNILDPFRKHLDPTAPYLARANSSSIPHRYLYQAWVHQFHSIQFTKKLLLLLREIHRIDVERPIARVWGPSISKLFLAETWHVYGDTPDMQGEEDPQSIPGPCATGEEKENLIIGLGDAKARDPEALPVDSWLGAQGLRLYELSNKLFEGNLLFVWKVAALTALISLPSFLRSSAHFMYSQKGIWAIFMAQLTAARFRGDTALGLMSRIASTILGATIGLVIWYIGAGNGPGNPYGVAAVTAVTFPLVYLLRLYYPGPPITAIITCVTVALIVGYSYKDGHNPSYSSPGVGFEVGWKRLAAAAAGCTAAFFWAFLPPSSTGREYQRISHATTIAELGRLHCDLVSLVAHPRPAPEDEVATVRLRLVAVRAKLRRLQASTHALAYEFSLRGKWPAERYAELSNVQMEISKLMSHLVAVSDGLSPKYATALLRRTRFLDPLFLGDCISVISMCSTALRTARPLPQITACPLVDRFLLFEHGEPHFTRTKDDDDDDDDDHGDDDEDDGADPKRRRNQNHEHHEDDLGLPRLMTMATLQEPDFMIFAVGVSTSLGIVLRIDKLCIAVKQLVGESFAVTADVHRRNVLRRQDWGRR